jgi:hypothetical protein
MKNSHIHRVQTKANLGVKQFHQVKKCEYAIIHWCMVDHESIWFPIRIHGDHFFNLARDNHNFISLAFAPLKQLEYKDGGLGIGSPWQKGSWDDT